MIRGLRFTARALRAWASLATRKGVTAIKATSASAHKDFTAFLSKPGSAPLAAKGMPGAAKEKIRVAIVDDEAEIRLLLQALLEESGEFICVGSYASARESLIEIPKASPALVLMDIQMPGISGIECTRQLKKMIPSIRIVMVSGLVDPALILESLNAGSDDYITKPFSLRQLVVTMKVVLSRSPNRPQPEAPSEVHLTDRERQIMVYLCAGMLQKEIADKLGISFSLVHKLQNSAFHKLHATNRMEAARKFQEGNRG